VFLELDKGRLAVADVVCYPVFVHWCHPTFEPGFLTLPERVLQAPLERVVFFAQKPHLSKGFPR
jgi:hypothetical protein